MTDQPLLPGADMPMQLLQAARFPPGIDPLAPDRLRSFAKDRSVVIVHCTIPANEAPGFYYIQRTTALLDHQARRKHPLLHAEGIGHGDTADVIKRCNRPLHFTLYFLGLAKECSVFDLVEHSSDPFPFVVRSIARNARDVYHVTFTEGHIAPHTSSNPQDQ